MKSVKNKRIYFMDGSLMTHPMNIHFAYDSKGYLREIRSWFEGKLKAIAELYYDNDGEINFYKDWNGNWYNKELFNSPFPFEHLLTIIDIDEMGTIDDNGHEVLRISYSASKHIKAMDEHFKHKIATASGMFATCVLISYNDNTYIRNGTLLEYEANEKIIAKICLEKWASPISTKNLQM